MQKYGAAGEATDDNIIGRMRYICWINRAINTHSKYVIFIAFPQQQLLRARASMSRDTYVSCLITTYLGADKSLAQPGRKQATATKLLLLQATQKIQNVRPTRSPRQQ